MGAGSVGVDDCYLAWGVPSMSGIVGIVRVVMMMGAACYYCWRVMRSFATF